MRKLLNAPRDLKATDIPPVSTFIGVGACAVFFAVDWYCDGGLMGAIGTGVGVALMVGWCVVRSFVARGETPPPRSA